MGPERGEPGRQGHVRCRGMTGTFDPSLAAGALVGVAIGLVMLARGMSGYRTALRIGDTSSSSIASLAAGEVRVAGTIETADATLTSPLQSQPCVYYRSSIRREDDLGDALGDLTEERAVGFLVRDGEGATIRVFPRGARWDAPVRFDAKTGTFGEEPAGLDLRTGSAVALEPADRAAAVAALLTVQQTRSDEVHPLLRDDHRGTRRYREARLGPGDEVTIVGRAMPFGDLSDPTEADVSMGGVVGVDDPEVVADLAEARAAGRLADDPTEAWGNAAIPGFGIGRPTRPPELDPDADHLPLAPASEAARAQRRFTIAPETLVLASGLDVPLLIAYGVPGAATARSEGRFALGLLGAVLSIASAMALAIMFGGGFGA